MRFCMAFTVIGLVLNADALLFETRYSGGGTTSIPGFIRTAANEVLDQNNVIAGWEYPKKRASRLLRRKGGAAHQ
jgi:hypothetical protein